MLKRPLPDESREEPPSKRSRQQPDRLSALSDELLLHVLSFLSIPSLITCQRVSHRFAVLAGDSELWKRKYYSRWVWPRARRLRHVAHGRTPGRSLGYSPRVSNWFSHGPLTKVGEDRNWKGQYRLQHNWSRGSCRVTEVEVAQRPLAPVVVKLEHGVVFTADVESGLRAWSMKDTKTCLATTTFDGIGGNKEATGIPTAIAVTPDDRNQDEFDVAVGFGHGGIAVYSLTLRREAGPALELQLWRQHPAEAAIMALAAHRDFLLVLSEDRELRLYQLRCEKSQRVPSLIASLVANNIQSPFSLSVRTTASHVIASVTYTFPRIGCGWSVGIQELYWNKDTGDLTSRLATTVESQFLGNTFAEPTKAGDRGPSKTSFTQTPSLTYTQPPTSLSYAHPYLLASHSDNTLTMYLVVSTVDDLAVKAGRRLWGHTSAVSGVQVSSRGKAVSVSAKGDEIRVWELEDMISSRRPGSKVGVTGERSVQLSPEPRRPRSSALSVLSRAVERQIAAMEGARRGISSELKLSCIKGPVEFDDEQVVVLREQNVGTQLLGCYDFT